MATHIVPNLPDGVVPTWHGRGRLLLAAACCWCFTQALSAAETMAANTKLTAAEIVEKFVAARGGAQSWHAIKTMSWSGKMEVGSADSATRSANYVRSAMMQNHKKMQTAANDYKSLASPQVQLPFLLEMKRPGKSRIEIEFAGKTAVQVYDGTNGWKLRPFLNRSDVEPFTEEEAKSQEGIWDIEGPLVNYSTKGTKVALEAVEPVEGRDAYKLKLTLKNGKNQHIWIDAHSFLDVKVEGSPRQLDGRMRTVWIYQREFRPVQGLMIPFVLETAVDGYPSNECGPLWAMAKAAKVWTDLDGMGVPGIKGVWSPPEAAGWGMTVVSIEQRYAGHAAQVGALAAQCMGGAYFTKYIVVVDDDVDPSSLPEVIWAMVTRSRPAQSIDILRETWSTFLDPSQNPPEIRPFGSKCIINACKEFKYLKVYSPRSLLKKEMYETVCARWSELGFEGQPPIITNFEPFTGQHIG